MGSKLTISDVTALRTSVEIKNYHAGLGDVETNVTPKYTVKPRKGNNSKRQKPRKKK